MAEFVRTGTGLSYGLLLWVLAGHAAAVWLARTRLEAGPDSIQPRVLRVSWVEAAQAPAPVPPAAPSVRKPAETIRPAVAAPAEPSAPEPARPAPESATEPVPEPAPAAPQAAARPAPNPVPAAAPAAHAPAAPPAVPVGAAIAPTPPELPVPPSYHADYLANPAPAYPAIARRMREEGLVRLRVLVGADGLPREVRLDAGSGHPRLDEAARAAVAGWRFVPARLGGQAVAGWVGVPISFSLRR